MAAPSDRPPGGALWGAALALVSASGCGSARPPDVVIIVMDTVRADVHAEVDTPVFDAVAAAGAAPRAWAGSTWTAPSTISLMTGLPVYAHGWDFSFPRHLDEQTHSYPAIPGALPTLGTVLAGEGYQTVGLYGNMLLSRPIGWQRGFAVWEHVPDKAIAEDVAARVAALDPDQPAFFYIHLKGAHYPCQPAPESRRKWDLPQQSWLRGAITTLPERSATYQARYRRAYRAEVEDTDARVGAILEALGSRAEGVVVITADHGELLGEHGEWGHDHWLWEPLPGVPFAAKGLGALPSPFSTVGVAARVAAAAGAGDVFPTLDGAPLAQREGHVATTLADGTKAIWDPRLGSGLSVYSLADDPRETTPLWHPLDRARLVLARARAEAALPHRSLELVPTAMTEETLGLLEELGYMGN